NRDSLVPFQLGASGGLIVPADLIANTANRANQRTLGAGIELAAKIVDVNVDDVGDRSAIHSPNLLDDRGARHRAARIAQQEFQQRIFARAELDLAAAAADAVADAVDFEVFVEKDVVDGTRAAAQDSLDARDEFRDGKGLHEEIV